MAKTKTIRAAVLGASGYTGADMIRLAARHPAIEITALIAKGHAGMSLAQVFPHLPRPARSASSSWLSRRARRSDDVVVVRACTAPRMSASVDSPPVARVMRVIDSWRTFALRDPKLYPSGTANEHDRSALLNDAVYGLPEHHRDAIRRRAARRVPRLLPDLRDPRAVAAARAR